MRSRLTALALLLAPLLGAAPTRHVLPPDLVDPPCVALVPLEGSASVLLPDGLREDSTAVVVADGRIIAVDLASRLRSPDGTFAHRGATCAVVDTTGRTVIPGMVEVASQIGLVEVGLEAGTANADAGGDHAVRASLRVAEAYDPRSVVIPEQRVEGLTSALTNPSGGLVSGQAAFVDLAGADQRDAVVEPSAAMVANLVGSSRAEAVRELREVLRDARAYQRNRAAFERNAFRPLQAHRLDLEALAPVVDGRLPLIVGADRASDIEALLRLAEELGIRLVISGGAEAWRHAEALARAGVAVVVDPLVYGPGSFDQVGARPDNAALLAQAGVPVILATFSSHNARTLRQNAGNAVRGGMSREQALRAVTTTPARLFGGADRGEIKVGQVANLAVFDGDPLELFSQPTHLLIRGRPIPLDSRQWRLTLRYLDSASAPPLPAEVPGR